MICRGGGATRWVGAGILLLAAAAIGVGCAKNQGAASGQSDAALIAAGQAAFAANGCSRCHALGGQGGRQGPDLTHIGSGPGRTPQWLADHVKNPKLHNPGSRMPSFEGKMSDQDLLAIGTFLASLK